MDKKFYIVDLPGYGFAKRAPADKAKWSKLTDSYFTSGTMNAVAQLIDLKVGPTADDEMMLRFLRESSIPFLVVATKCDKLNATERKKSEELLRSHPDIPSDTPILFYSALKTVGKQELWKEILQFSEL